MTIETSDLFLETQQSLFSGDYDGDGDSELLTSEYTVTKSEPHFVYHTNLKIYDRTNIGTLEPTDWEMPLVANLQHVSNGQSFLGGLVGSAFGGAVGGTTMMPHSYTANVSNDFNGDGRDDILLTDVVNGSNSSFRLSKLRFLLSSTNDASDFTQTPPEGYAPPIVQHDGAQDEGWLCDYVYPSTFTYHLTGDFNGDGKCDVLLLLGSGHAFHTFLYSPFTGGNGIIGQEVYCENGIQSNLMTCSLMSIDIDGDGAHEIMARPGPNSLYQGVRIFKYSMLPEPRFWTVHESLQFPTASDWLHPADFNGDGKTDFLYRNGGTNAPWYIRYSIGTDFSDPFPFTEFNITVDSHLSVPDVLKIGDYNGDGRSDICHAYATSDVENEETTMIDLFYGRGSLAGFGERSYIHDGVFDQASELITDMNGDGRSDLIATEPFSPLEMFYFDKDGHERSLDKVVNGMNAAIDFDYTYARTSDETIAEAEFTYPAGKVKLPIEVVSMQQVPDGLGGTVSTLYAFKHSIVNRTGRGFVGFKETIQANPVMNASSISLFDVHPEYNFLIPYRTLNYRIDTEALLGYSEWTFAHEPLGALALRRFLTKPLTTTSHDHLALTNTVQTNSYGDTYGNVTSSTTNVHNIEITTTTANYVAAGPSSAWSKPENVTVSRTRIDADPVSKNSRNTYDATTGNLLTSTEFQGLPDASVTTTFSYNSTGTVRTKAMSAPSVIVTQWPREEFRYDTKHRFVREAIRKWMNNGSYVDVTTTTETDPKWGKLLTVHTPDGLLTAFHYGVFGQLESTDAPHPVGDPIPYTASVSRIWALNGLEYYATSTVEPGGSDLTTRHDLLGRPIRSQVEGFGGQDVHSSVDFDQRGNAVSETTPHKTGEDYLTITHEFDALNRPVQDVNPLTGNTTRVYAYMNGEHIVTVTSLAGWASNITDAAGRTVKTTDDGGVLKHTYDSWGNLVKVRHGNEPVAWNTYDAYGRQATLWVPGAGTTEYVYNAFGKLIYQKDPNNNEVTLDYDNLGRLMRRYAPEGNTQYAYYHLNGEITDNPMFVIGPGVTRSFAYDNYHRMVSTTSTIAGQNYQMQYAYDEFDRVTQQTYPSGLVVNSTYDATGGLDQRYWADGTLFRAYDKNGLGQLTEYEMADGRQVRRYYTHGFLERIAVPDVQDLLMSYDYGSGNMVSRQDALQDILEDFDYDELNRLIGSTVSHFEPGTQIGYSVSHDYAYDGEIGDTRGGLVMRSDIGQLPYGTKVTAAQNIHYPVVYNQLPFVISQATQKITYTPFLKTGTIDELVNGDAYFLTYEYGPEHQRTRSLLTKNNNNNDRTERIYLGDYEKQIINGTTQEIHYIAGGTGLCAMIVKTGNTYAAYATYTDHLGSIVEVTSANDGTVVARQNFDPWGRDRRPGTWLHEAFTAPPTWLYRGFTGHEHVAPFSLINMNGRMYDPNTGRMLSVDNYVNGSSATQAFNRYTYAGNNPLRFADPSGDFIQLAVAGLIGGTINWLANGHSWDAEGLGYFGVGFLAGALSAGIANGVGVVIQGGCFGAGFTFSSTAAFGGGFIGGASGGFSSGIVTGFGNSMLSGDDLVTSIENGFRSGILQGATGGLIGGGIAGLNNRHFLTGQMNFADLRSQFIPLAQQEICDVYGDYVGDNTEVVGRRSIAPLVQGETTPMSLLGYDADGFRQVAARSEFSEHTMRSFMRGGRQGWATVIHEGRHGADLVTGMEARLLKQISLPGQTPQEIAARMGSLSEFRAFSTQWMLTHTQKIRYMHYYEYFNIHGPSWLPFGGLTF